MQKCMLVCQNCHCEIHSEMIEDEFLKFLYQEKWGKIHLTCKEFKNIERN
jgi:hypothetical protein